MKVFASSKLGTFSGVWVNHKLGKVYFGPYPTQHSTCKFGRVQWNLSTNAFDWSLTVLQNLNIFMMSLSKFTFKAVYLKTYRDI